MTEMVISTGIHRVVVSYRGDRKKFILRHLDPAGRVLETLSTDSKSRKEAERHAVRWEAQLNEGLYKKSSRVKWSDFREDYVDLHVSTLAETTAGRVKALSLIPEAPGSHAQKLNT